MTARTQSPSDSDMEATAFGHVRGRRHRHNQIRFFTIAEVAERLHVATVRSAAHQGPKISSCTDSGFRHRPRPEESPVHGKPSTNPR